MSTVRTIAVISTCIAGSAAFSIGPYVSAVWRDTSAVVPGVWQFLILQTAATIVMAWCSHHAGASREWGKKLTCLGLVVLIGYLQFGAALEVASHKRDSGSAVGKRSASAVERDLTAERNSRAGFAQLPALPALDRTLPVTVEMVVSAIKAETDECKGGVGGNCRMRQAELKDILQRRPVSEKIEELELELNTAPRHLDGMGYRMSLILQKLGVDADEASVTDWWPTFQAFMVELIAGAGPYALSKPEPRAPRTWRWPVIRLARWRRAGGTVPAPPIEAVDDRFALGTDLLQPPAVAPTVEKPALRKTPVTAEKSRKPRNSNTSAVTPAREWWDERTVERVGADIRPKEEAYPDYVNFAEGRAELPMSMTAFGTELRNMSVATRTLPSKAKLYTNRALAHRTGLTVVK